MNVAINTAKLTRSLYGWERNLLFPIFGNSLRYEKVRIHEFAGWPDKLDDFGRRVKRVIPRDPSIHNAVTLPNNCYFPVGLPLEQPVYADPAFINTGWLVHEITHCWQFQKIGLGYVYRTVRAQFQLGGNVYDFGGARNLIAKRQIGWKIQNFNLEQQGDICRFFFFASEDLPGQQELYAAALPYIQDIQNS